MSTPQDCPIINREMRRADDPWRADITQSIDLLKSQHKSLSDDLARNTETTNTIKANTDEIVEFFKAAKGFFVVAGYFGKVMKWAGAVAAAVTAIWAAREIGK